MGFGGEAQTYTGQEHACFVVSTGTTPDDLKMVEGIEETREVYFFTEDGPGTITPADSGDPADPADQENSDPTEGGRTDVSELLLVRAGRFLAVGARRGKHTARRRRAKDG